MKTSENINEILPALMKAKGSIGSAKKDKVNPFHKSRYADLSSVHEACDQALSENGLILIQDVEGDETRVLISTRMMHTSGQWLEVGPLCLPLSQNTPQAVGSCITYGRRYSISSLLCITTEDDDDANRATIPEPKKKETERPKNIDKIVNSGRISANQLGFLKDLLNRCEATYVETFDKHLLKQFDIKEYSQISVELFDRLIKGINLYLANASKVAHV